MIRVVKKAAKLPVTPDNDLAQTEMRTRKEFRHLRKPGTGHGGSSERLAVADPKWRIRGEGDLAAALDEFQAPVAATGRQAEGDQRVMREILHSTYFCVGHQIAGACTKYQGLLDNF